MRIDDPRSFRAGDGLLSYAAPPGTRPSPGLGARCARLLAALRAHWRERHAAAELAALSTRMLADIGLTRADLPRFQRRWRAEEFR
ncbi:DUF1127 domain-containing protein [Siccirubricoccus phaeus]|uniref:DUF1127 domain-containing protein n=1 Tax=Siccirubricoccus phaeus TaxID=2595053 RepID=UPI0011F13A7E|nr:DUF1127 domain-containing protein [Siccirubricoccus phaeus]